MPRLAIFVNISLVRIGLMPGFNVELIQKIELIEKVYLLTFVTDQVTGFKPGQYASLETAPKVHRAYSIAHLDKRKPFFAEKFGSLPEITENQQYMSLIISTKPAGQASDFIDQVKVGTANHILAISGRFGVAPTNLPKIFICTGTGLAPFVPMIQQVFEQNPVAEVKLFFGAVNRANNFSKKFFSPELLSKPSFEIFSCIDEEKFEEDDHTLIGRVNDIVPRLVSNVSGYEFYLCGHPLMVQAMDNKLKELEVPKVQILKESFGSVKQSNQS